MLKDGSIASDLEKPTQEEIVAEVTALTNIKCLDLQSAHFSL